MNDSNIFNMMNKNVVKDFNNILIVELAVRRIVKNDVIVHKIIKEYADIKLTKTIMES